MSSGAMTETEADTPTQLLFMPSLLWSQIYHKLVHFLDHGVGAGGYRVLRWKHRCIAELVASRYLTPAEKMKSTAGILADYFLKTGLQSSGESGYEVMNYYLTKTLQ